MVAHFSLDLVWFLETTLLLSQVGHWIRRESQNEKF